MTWTGTALERRSPGRSSLCEGASVGRNVSNAADRGTVCFGRVLARSGKFWVVSCQKRAHLGWGRVPDFTEAARAAAGTGCRRRQRRRSLAQPPLQIPVHLTLAGNEVSSVEHPPVLYVSLGKGGRHLSRPPLSVMPPLTCRASLLHSLRSSWCLGRATCTAWCRRRFRCCSTCCRPARPPPGLSTAACR